MDEDFDSLEDSNYFIDDSSYFDEPEDVQRLIFARQSKEWKLKVGCILGIINHREKRKAIARRLRPFGRYFINCMYFTLWYQICNHLCAYRTSLD